MNINEVGSDMESHGKATQRNPYDEKAPKITLPQILRVEEEMMEPQAPP